MDSFRTPIFVFSSLKGGSNIQIFALAAGAAGGAGNCEVILSLEKINVKEYKKINEFS